MAGTEEKDLIAAVIRQTERTNEQGKEKKDSMQRGTCRGCGAEILWIRTPQGTKMPIDAEPVWVKWETGGNTFIREDGSFIFGRKVGDAYDDPDGVVEEAHESHFANCPVGGQFKNRKPRTRPPGFR